MFHITEWLFGHDRLLWDKTSMSSILQWSLGSVYLGKKPKIKNCYLLCIYLAIMWPNNLEHLKQSNLLGKISSSKFQLIKPAWTCLPFKRTINCFRLPAYIHLNAGWIYVTHEHSFDGLFWDGFVLLGSTARTFVMQIEGKDDDEAGTDNSKIAYSIVSQEPEGTGHMFRIEEKTGKLYVNKATLDREVRLLMAQKTLSVCCSLSVQTLSECFIRFSHLWLYDFSVRQVNERQI